MLRLDDTVTRATLGVVRSQLDELLAREARLLAERDDADAIVFPAQLTSGREDASVATAVAGEQRLFESRRSARTGQRSQLRERIAQTNEEIRGLSAQQEAKESELKLIAKELVGVTELYKKNLVSISRFTQLQRDQTRLQGERGQLIADIARARGKISETELQIIQLDQDFRTEVLKDLRETQGKIAELKERVTAAEDQLKRIDLRAPQTGVVHQLSVHTVGGVIANGELIMQIVPRADELVVEAKVAPNDIDQIAIGSTAIVRSWPATSAPRRKSSARSPGSPPTSRASSSRSSKIPRSRRRPITPFASRCRRRRWPASRISASFPACRSRSSSRPTSAARCSICSSRCANRSRAPSANADR